MSYFNARHFIILAVGLSLANCGQLPKPFKPDTGSGAESPLLAIQDSIGVIVAPITGAPWGVAGPLSDAMAADLRRVNVPATTASTVKSAFLLEGHATAELAKGNRLVVIVDWAITNSVGDVVFNFATRSKVPVSDWQTGKRASINAVSADAVPRIADTLQTGFTLAGQKPPPTIAVVGIEGAPSDGNEALRKAFAAVLKNAGLPVAGDPQDAAIQIFGKVYVSDLPADREKLEIEWFLQEPDGRKIGTLMQSNSGEKGRVASKWGPLAYDVTFAMVEPIAEFLLIIERADEIRLDQ